MDHRSVTVLPQTNQQSTDVPIAVFRCLAASICVMASKRGAVI